MKPVSYTHLDVYKRQVEDIPVGNKQKVEILKALLRGAEVLILDEPTAVLTPQEIKQLFVELKNIAKMGHSIIFISHHLDEVKELCDNLTVLRLGKTVGTAVVADVTEQQISKMMVGRDVVLKVEKTPAKPVSYTHLVYDGDPLSSTCLPDMVIGAGEIIAPLAD